MFEWLEKSTIPNATAKGPFTEGLELPNCLTERKRGIRLTSLAA